MDIATLQKENKALRVKNAQPIFRLEQLERLFLNSKYERFVPNEAAANQPTLFEGLEEKDKQVEQPVEEQIKYKRRKPYAIPHSSRCDGQLFWITLQYNKRSSSPKKIRKL